MGSSDDFNLAHKGMDISSFLGAAPQNTRKPTRRKRLSRFEELLKEIKNCKDSEENAILQAELDFVTKEEIESLKLPEKSSRRKAHDNLAKHLRRVGGPDGESE